MSRLDKRAGYLDRDLPSEAMVGVFPLSENDARSISLRRKLDRIQRTLVVGFAALFLILIGGVL